jgi:hypothetical protein
VVPQQGPASARVARTARRVPLSRLRRVFPGVADAEALGFCAARAAAGARAGAGGGAPAAAPLAPLEERMCAALPCSAGAASGVGAAGAGAGAGAGARRGGAVAADLRGVLARWETASDAEVARVKRALALQRPSLLPGFRVLSKYGYLLDGTGNIKYKVDTSAGALCARRVTELEWTECARLVQARAPRPLPPRRRAAAPRPSLSPPPTRTR